MHNIKNVRKNFDKFKAKLKNRNIITNFDKIINLDKRNRELIQDKEALERDKKDISKKKDQSLFEKSKDISNKIVLISENQKKIKNDLDNILSSLPNIALDDVPIGSDEKANKEIEKKGIIRRFNFKPKPHYILGENLNMLDFDLAAKTTGSRFTFVTGKLARLERAISNFMLDLHVNINGYEEISPPLIANYNTMYGTGQLPKFENDQFEIKLDDKNDRKFLIPTAEVILTNIVKNKILDI